MSDYRLTTFHYHGTQATEYGEQAPSRTILRDTSLMLPPLQAPVQPQRSWDSSVRIAPLRDPDQLSTTYRGLVVPGTRVWLERHHMRELMPRGGFTPGVDGQTISQLPSVYFRSSGQLGFPLRDGIQRNYDALDGPDAPVGGITYSHSLAFYRETNRRKTGFEKQDIVIHEFSLRRKPRLLAKTNKQLVDATMYVIEHFWFKINCGPGHCERDVTLFDGSTQTVHVQDLILIALEHMPGRDSSEWIPIFSWDPRGLSEQ